MGGLLSGFVGSEWFCGFCVVLWVLRVGGFCVVLWGLHVHPMSFGFPACALVSSYSLETYELESLNCPRCARVCDCVHARVCLCLFVPVCAMFFLDRPLAHCASG